LLICTPYTS